MNDDLTKHVMELIERKNFGFLATIMSDGSPQVTPVWVDHDRDIILINTVKGRVKQMNTAKEPRVALAIVDKDNPYDMVTIRGRVIEQTTLDADKHIDKLAKKYLGLDKYLFRSDCEQRILLKIKPGHITWRKQ